MELFINYAGASIDILENDVTNNTIILSPKVENNAFSNYFNFKVKNDSKQIGTIYIKNLNKLLYNSNIIPFIRRDGELFKHINEDRITYTPDGIKIMINANEQFEISSYPRYVEDDLNKFLKNIKNDFVNIDDGVVKKITIGEANQRVIVIIGRQHPGETLSSYFIEGIISEIVNNYQDYKDICFVFFPIVSVNGVKNGNHRYTDNIDLNRSWNCNGLVKELDFIKEELKKYNIECFVDVHCDEVSKIDYIRTKKPMIDGFCDIKIIEDQTKLKRFLRALIKQRKIIDLSQMTAREYVTKCYGCNNMLIELSLNNNDGVTSTIKGEEFVKTLKRSRK